ncbi:MAG: polysaccharide deacetylase family protein [Acidobacteria bacterium]|nr:polysaccharide deacetylase family protein [Acidobacteriota bacterium]
MLGMVIAASAAMATYGYQCLAPTGQWFGRAFHGARRGSKQSALTFDDGPNDPHTLKLLDILAKHKVLATFFFIGHYVEQAPHLAREVAERGHVVGNHTFSHPLLIFQSPTRIRQEILDCRKAISDALGEHSNLFRPPWGGRRPGVFRLVRELGLEPIMWSITGYDWNASLADEIERRVGGKIRGGDIVLLHDGSHATFGADRSKTTQAVDHLITRYRAQAYQFVTIPEMMRSSEPS